MPMEMVSYSYTESFFTPLEVKANEEHEAQNTPQYFTELSPIPLANSTLNNYRLLCLCSPQWAMTTM